MGSIADAETICDHPSVETIGRGGIQGGKCRNPGVGRRTTQRIPPRGAPHRVSLRLTGHFPLVRPGFDPPTDSPTGQALVTVPDEGPPQHLGRVRAAERVIESNAREGTMRLSRKELAPAGILVTTGDWLVNRFGMTTKAVVQPGQRDVLVDLLLAAAERVADAPGCYLYVVSTSLDAPDEVWVSEAWRSKAHYEAWMSRPEVLQLFSAMTPLIASRTEPVLVVPVGGKGLQVRRRRS
jgi:quinol monooxygenase YgiN